MVDYSKRDLDKITTITGAIAGVCLGIAGLITSTLTTVPGDKIFGLDKTPVAAIASVFGGIGATALTIQGLFTNKPASQHPTTADLEGDTLSSQQQPQTQQPPQLYYNPPDEYLVPTNGRKVDLWGDSPTPPYPDEGGTTQLEIIPDDEP